MTKSFLFSVSPIISGTKSKLVEQANALDEYEHGFVGLDT